MLLLFHGGGAIFIMFLGLERFCIFFCIKLFMSGKEIYILVSTSLLWLSLIPMSCLLLFDMLDSSNKFNVDFE